MPAVGFGFPNSIAEGCEMKASHLQTEAMAVSIAEAARLLKVSERTLWQLARDGKVPHKRVGKQYRFSPEVLRGWMGGGQVTHC
jgi:excisionase family DNA binding protein